MASENLGYTSAAELAGMIRRRQISPVEVMDRTIARIEQRNPSLNALIYLAFDEARAEARKAERAVMTGEALTPLHGVPAAMKDLFDFKPGWPTTFGGVRALKDNIAQFYCPFAERIGANHILWSANFPLATSTWPRTQETIARCLQDVSAQTREKVLWQNAATLYRL